MFTLRRPHIYRHSRFAFLIDAEDFSGEKKRNIYGAAGGTGSELIYPKCTMNNYIQNFPEDRGTSSIRPQPHECQLGRLKWNQSSTELNWNFVSEAMTKGDPGRTNKWKIIAIGFRFVWRGRAPVIQLNHLLNMFAEGKKTPNWWEFCCSREIT